MKPLHIALGCAALAGAVALPALLQHDPPASFGAPSKIEWQSIDGHAFGLVPDGGGFTLTFHTAESGVPATKAWILWGKLLDAPLEDPMFGERWIEPVKWVEQLEVDALGTARGSWSNDAAVKKGVTYSGQLVFEREPGPDGKVDYGRSLPFSIEAGGAP